MTFPLLETIKRNLDIVAVISEHLTLDSHLKALCPFHTENTPSFSVNQKGQYFHCFGCGVGGDVFRFIELYEKKHFGEVLSMLAERAGISLSEFTRDDHRSINEGRLIEEILTETAEFYHKSLTKEAEDYLQKQRGFTSETTTRFRLGFAQGGLRKRLVDDCQFPLDLCLKSGVLKNDKNGTFRDYFYNRIVFPNRTRGRVVFLTGRVLDDRKPKYLNLPGEINHLFNEDELFNNEIILVEGAPDCITLIQNGFHAVGLPGASGFKTEFAEKFRKNERVYVCLDSDDAGKSAAMKIGEILADKAIIVSMPEGLDINDYSKTNSTDDFQKLLDAGKSYLDIEIENIKASPSNTQLDKIKKFLPNLACLDEFRRSHYIDMIKKNFDISKKTIAAGIQRREIAPIGDTQTANNEEQEPPYTNEERDEALSLLKDPGLLGRLIQSSEKLGCVGEENNQIIIFLTLLSRILEDPISLIVKGDSSGGKSFLVETMSQFFPSDQILAFTLITPKALYHRKDDLSHKALIVYERPGAEESDYSIRTLQSEKKLIISMAVKDKETGRFETIDQEVSGPVAYIETTTQTHLHSENETRCFEVFIDDSEEQTSKIQAMQRKKYGMQEVAKRDEVKVWMVAQHLLKPFPVVVPFIDLIKFPSKPLRVRRDFPRFMTMIEVSAILHQHQRKREIINGIEYLVADIEDYAVAFRLTSNILGQTIKQISPRAEQLIHAIENHMEDFEDSTFTRREIADLMEWDIKTITKYISECEKLGLLDVDSGGRGTSYKYRFIRLPAEQDNLLVHPDQLRDSYEADSSSKKGRVIQKVFGEANPLGTKGLSQPRQDIQEIKENNSKQDRQASVSVENQSSMFDGYGG